MTATAPLSITSITDISPSAGDPSADMDSVYRVSLSDGRVIAVGWKWEGTPDAGEWWIYATAYADADEYDARDGAEIISDRDVIGDRDRSIERAQELVEHHYGIES